MATTEERLTALESKVEALSEHRAMESGLSASHDRDIADIKVTLKSHTAMHQPHNEKLSAQNRRFTGLEGEFRGLQAEMRDGFALVHQGLQAIVHQLDGLSPKHD